MTRVDWQGDPCRFSRSIHLTFWWAWSGCGRDKEGDSRIRCVSREPTSLSLPHSLTRYPVTDRRPSTFFSSFVGFEFVPFDISFFFFFVLFCYSHLILIPSLFLPNHNPSSHVHIGRIVGTSLTSPAHLQTSLSQWVTKMLSTWPSWPSRPSATKVRLSVPYIPESTLTIIRDGREHEGRCRRRCRAHR